MFIDNASLSPMTIHEYDNITLQCQAQGQPIPWITWFHGRNQTHINPTVLANNTDGQYHLVNVTREQSGYYECRASNGVNGHVISKHVELRVLCKYSLRLSVQLIFSMFERS
jgi:hypothetical protein